MLAGETVVALKLDLLRMATGMTPDELMLIETGAVDGGLISIPTLLIPVTITNGERLVTWPQTTPVVALISVVTFSHWFSSKCSRLTGPSRTWPVL